MLYFPDPPRIPKSTVHRTKSQLRGWGRDGKVPPWIWRKGRQHYSIHRLAWRRGVSYAVAYNFAVQHPHLSVREGCHIYCQDEPAPPIFPTNFYRDGFEYLSMQSLAARRHIRITSVRAWVKKHPHLTVYVRRRPYARDEEWRPRKLPAYIWRDGFQYFSTYELARRRGIFHSPALQWIKSHPHLSIHDGPHLYTRDEEWRPNKLPPHIWRDRRVYYSLSELARRRGVCKETVRKWVLAHPHLTICDGRFRYTRDEEWTPKGPWERPPDPVEPPPPIPLAVRYGPARRAAQRAARA